VCFNRGTICCRLMFCISTEEQSAVALCRVFQQRNNLLAPYVVYFNRGTICCSLMLCISTEEQSAVAYVVFQQRNNLLSLMLCISTEEQSACPLMLYISREEQRNNLLSLYVVYFNRGTICCRLLLCISTEEQSPVALCCVFQIQQRNNLLSLYVVPFCHFLIIHHKELSTKQQSSYVYVYYFSIRIVYFDEESDCHDSYLLIKFRTVPVTWKH
jgi:hypothetical protein